MAEWYYSKEGLIQDQTVGPIDAATLAARLEAGEIGLDTSVSSPSATGGAWRKARDFPRMIEMINKGEQQRSAEAERQKELKRQEQEVARKEKEAARELALRERQMRLTGQGLVVGSPQQGQMIQQHGLLPSLNAQGPPPLPAIRGQLMPDGPTSSPMAYPAGYPQQIMAVMPSAPPAVNVVVNQQTNVNGFGRKRFNPLVAAILSFLVPGLGQLYKGQPINGLVWFVVVGIVYGIFFVPGMIAVGASVASGNSHAAEVVSDIARFWSVPGLIVHICCIIGAASGDPYR